MGRKTVTPAGEIPLSKLKINARNPRKISPADMERLGRSIEHFPEMMELNKIVVDEDWNVLGGSQRVVYLRQSGRTSIPEKWVEIARGLTPEQKKEFIAKHNSHYGDWDWDLLLADYSAEVLLDYGIDIPGLADPRDKYLKEEEVNPLVETFIVPPFSTLDCRSGAWVKRKRAWHDRIGDFGETRQGTLAGGENNILMMRINAGVSILDPVLAEVICWWYSPGENVNVFDCFAGDTVFGFVAGSMGLNFTGIELRPEQAEINNARCRFSGLPARYICDDGRNVAQHLAPESQDLFFSCPPYYDLEKYSDLPNDASNQETYEDFIALLRDAFHASAACLKKDRFAVIVVGDIRDKKGAFRRFPEHVVQIMQEAGLCLLNELILLVQIGTAQIRARGQFVGRKNVKTHQNVLVFYKGNPKDVKHNFPALTEAYDKVDFSQFKTPEAPDDEGPEYYASENLEL